MSIPEPKFEVGQAVAVCCLPISSIVIPRAITTSRRFVRRGRFVAHSSGRSCRSAITSWIYGIDVAGGEEFAERTLRPIDPQGEYLEESRTETVEESAHG